MNTLTHHESARLASLVAARLDTLRAALRSAPLNSTRHRSLQAEILFWDAIAAKLPAPHLLNR